MATPVGDKALRKCDAQKAGAEIFKSLDNCFTISIDLKGSFESELNILTSSTDGI